VGTALSILLSLATAFAQGASLAFGSIRGEGFTNSVAEESAQYNTISQSVVEKASNKEEKIESLRPQPLNSFEDDPEIFLTEDDRLWLKAMDCAFSREVHHV
jgi:hypothetical protein